MGFVVSWLVLSVSLYSPPAGATVYADPILSRPAPEMLQTIAMTKLEPQTALEKVWLNNLRPYGTYSNLYAPGNCTFGVASRLPIPNDWGNANNWAYAASLAGYTVSNAPRAGSIAQTTGDSYLGHVAAVTEVYPDGTFLIWEENAQGYGVVDERIATTAEFPSFIYI